MAQNGNDTSKYSAMKTESTDMHHSFYFHTPLQWKSLFMEEFGFYVWIEKYPALTIPVSSESGFQSFQGTAHVSELDFTGLELRLN